MLAILLLLYRRTMATKISFNLIPNQSATVHLHVGVTITLRLWTEITEPYNDAR